MEIWLSEKFELYIYCEYGGFLDWGNSFNFGVPRDALKQIGFVYIGIL